MMASSGQFSFYANKATLARTFLLFLFGAQSVLCFSPLSSSAAAYTFTKNRCYQTTGVPNRWIDNDLDSIHHAMRIAPLSAINGKRNSSNNNMISPEESFNVKINEFFKKPVPSFILESITVRREGKNGQFKTSPSSLEDILPMLTAPPSDPGVPRPLWLVMLGSVPTGLLWYGYYKFCVEEELLALELRQGEVPRGFGGFGTLGPFVYACLLGPVAFIFHLPGGLTWTYLGIAFIYYTQFLLYDRVNRLYREEGLEEPLPLWWTLPIFFPFDLIVGLRQVHFLSQYWYRKRGIDPPPTDPVAELFPFISAPRFTWQQFLLTPSLWFAFFANMDTIQRKSLPDPVQQFLSLGENNKQERNKRK